MRERGRFWLLWSLKFSRYLLAFVGYKSWSYYLGCSCPVVNVVDQDPCNHLCLPKFDFNKVLEVFTSIHPCVSDYIYSLTFFNINILKRIYKPVLYFFSLSVNDKSISFLHFFHPSLVPDPYSSLNSCILASSVSPLSRYCQCFWIRNCVFLFC